MAKLSDVESKEIYNSLTPDQKRVLDYHVKRGMKTKWLNAWAEKLGNVLTEEDLSDPDKFMENLLEWILVDYEDNLVVDGRIRCECGRALRHRYTLLHKPTGMVYKLGSVHFEQHTGLSPEMVSLITKGLRKIDLERDEILTKVKTKWKLPFTIPLGVEIPKDMAEQLTFDVPLLARQVKRLSDLVQKYNREYKTEIEWRRKQEELDRRAREEQAEREKVLCYNPKTLYQKLQAVKITAEEARYLFLYVKDYSDVLSKYELSPRDVKKAACYALGRIGNVQIRTWLVEIEYLVK